jgi:predicted HicB family RNase H-like nuclease
MPPRKDKTRDKTVQVRFTTDDHKRLVAAAKRSHLDLSVWVRQVVMQALERGDQLVRGVE